MNIPKLEQIESIVNKEYRPVTIDQAIKMTYWAFLNAMIKEETKKTDGEVKRRVLINNEWVEPTEEFSAIIDSIENNLNNKRKASDGIRD
jgi:hypothetical protein